MCRSHSGWDSQAPARPWGTSPLTLPHCSLTSTSAGPGSGLDHTMALVLDVPKAAAMVVNPAAPGGSPCSKTQVRARRHFTLHLLSKYQEKQLQLPFSFRDTATGNAHMEVEQKVQAPHPHASHSCHFRSGALPLTMPDGSGTERTTSPSYQLACLQDGKIQQCQPSPPSHHLAFNQSLHPSAAQGPNHTAPTSDVVVVVMVATLARCIIMIGS